jgi:uncharacterized membrane protein
MSDIKNDVFHKSFKIGLLLKGIDSILEIIGGILLIFMNKYRMNRIIVLLTQHELLEDPKDVIANYMIRLGSRFSISSQHFGVLYLMSHGLIKLVLVILLWQKKIWAYYLTIISLILFVFYQVYRYTITHSAWLMTLTVFDIIMIILTIIEYKRVKTEL